MYGLCSVARMQKYWFVIEKFYSNLGFTESIEHYTTIESVLCVNSSNLKFVLQIQEKKKSEPVLNGPNHNRNLEMFGLRM